MYTDYAVTDGCYKRSASTGAENVKAGSLLSPFVCLSALLARPHRRTRTGPTASDANAPSARRTHSVLDPGPVDACLPDTRVGQVEHLELLLLPALDRGVDVPVGPATRRRKRRH